MFGNRVFTSAVLALALSVCAAGQTATAPPKSIDVRIDAAKAGAPISPYIYGQFIEHIGDLINRSLWAEMLDDRKFYNEISSKPPVQGAGRGGGRGRASNSWRPIGPDESVVMDRRSPYVGVHTPLIRLAGVAPRGIQQSGLALQKGKAYTGRVVLAGEPGAKLTVSLVWADGAGGRQVIPITGLTPSYKKFPLAFTA
jgi:alpha-L-arabinofuranosidase